MSSSSSPSTTVASTFDFNRSQKFGNSINIPLLGPCKISTKEKRTIVEEYFFGLLTENKFTVPIESLATYPDYETIIKPLYAKSALTVLPVVQETYVKLLGPTSNQAFVAESFVRFSVESTKRSLKRRPEDNISLSLQCKNIPHLSLRVFKINMKNYWNVSGKNIFGNSMIGKGSVVDLDGLCPTWKKEFNQFSNEPAIRTKTVEFVFGRDGLAEEVFTGRGLWAIEFVGGKNQCKAVIQKVNNIFSILLSGENCANINHS